GATGPTGPGGSVIVLASGMISGTTLNTFTPSQALVIGQCQNLLMNSVTSTFNDRLQELQLAWTCPRAGTIHNLYANANFQVNSGGGAILTATLRGSTGPGVNFTDTNVQVSLLIPVVSSATGLELSAANTVNGVTVSAGNRLTL